MDTFTTVFFAAPAVREKRSWRRKWRIARRFPRTALLMVLTWMTTRVSRSPLAHCMIGHNGAVLDPSLAGNQFWPFIPFVLEYPALAWAIKVPLHKPIDLDQYRPNIPKRIWPTILRWWSGGRWPTEDCVCVVCDLLRDGGISVPQRIYKPVQLYEWLKAHGYQIIDLRANIS
jgi:hypothetical protein